MLGHQLCIDLFECDPSILDKPDEIESAVRALAQGIGAAIVHVSSYRFAPQGLSCMAQISASHIAIHTWPENRFAAVDVFSCTSRIAVRDMTDILQKAFGTRDVSCTEVRRGAELTSPFFREPAA